MATRYFEFKDGNSNKFWEAEVSGAVAHIRYGRIGTDGQRQVKEFSSEEEAQKFVDKKISEKVKEGYVESGKTGNASRSKKASGEREDTSRDGGKSIGETKENVAKLERFDVDQKKNFCDILARVAFEELTSPTYSNALDVLGIKEPKGYGYLSDEIDPNLYVEVEEAVTKMYYCRFVFLALYDIPAFFEYARQIERPVGEAIAMFHELPDAATSEEIDEWLKKVSGAFE